MCEYIFDKRDFKGLVVKKKLVIKYSVIFYFLYF